MSSTRYADPTLPRPTSFSAVSRIILRAGETTGEPGRVKRSPYAFAQGLAPRVYARPFVVEVVALGPEDEIEIPIRMGNFSRTS